MRVLFFGLAAALALAACSTPPAGHTRSAVSISVSQCGIGWTAARAGPEHIELRNADSRSGEARLIDPRTKAVYADIEPIGPGTTTSVDVNLAAGRYAWQCVMDDEPPVVGTTRTLAGPSAGAPRGVVPVSSGDLIAPSLTYQRYVTGQLPQLRSLATRLRDDLRRGELTAARRDWLPAHLVYERLGAAYDAFGALDGRIDGRPDGLSRGVHDSDWTGFHRIEYGLWHGQSAGVLAPLGDDLVRAIAALQKQFASAEIDGLTVSVRAHEISENALQFELTGQTDFGSHSELDTVRANLDGTQVVLDILHGLIAPRYPQLGRTEAELHQALTDLAARAGHERIDADVSELCELLAPVAAILEPRVTQ